MKIKLLAFVFLLTSWLAVFSQVPQKFAYQAVVRNATGEAIANQNVSVKITLLAGSVTGNAVYSEKHNLTTSPQGIINLTVGAGLLPIGSMQNVPWSESIFIKIELDPMGGNDFVLLGTSPILSVPYALQAGSLAKGIMEVKPTQGHNPEEPIFVVRNSNNQIVFAVYESGARVYIDDTGQPKSSRGGFAIGGLADQTKGDKGTKYLTIEPDSVRFNIQQPAKGKSSRGGFAIGGLADQTKEATGDYMTLRPDSIRFAIDESTITKSSRGGFAIGGLADQTKAFNNYFLVNRDSTFISNTLTAEGNVAVVGNILTGGTIGTLPTPPVTDAEGNVYTTKKIGKFIWMTENLRSTKYANGDAIPFEPLIQGFPYYTPIDSFYTPIADPKWGLLYNLQHINPLLICPAGWRLPSTLEWYDLVNSSGGAELAGATLKDPAYWWYPINSQPNGFNARPTGNVFSFFTTSWTHQFINYGTSATFWSMPQYVSVDPESAIFTIGPSDNFAGFNTVLLIPNSTFMQAHAIRCIKIPPLVSP